MDNLNFITSDFVFAVSYVPCLISEIMHFMIVRQSWLLVIMVEVITRKALKMQNNKKIFKKIKPTIIFFRHISENNNKNRWNIGEKRKILWQKKKEIFMKK